MLHPRDEALLREPDGILFSPENSTMLNDFLSPFTIPIHFFRGPVSSDTWNGNGTGVLVQLGGLAFVLTAGHCVRQYEDAQGCVVGVARARSRFEARFARRAYRADGFADYGFLEIPPAERPSYRAHDVFPMKPDRVLVTTPEALVSANDWMVLSGYPDEVTVKDADARGMRFFTYSTTSAGLDKAPRSTFESAPSGVRALDLWVSLRGQMQSFPELVSDARVPLFAGASGGGCWKAGVRPELAGFDPQRMQLVGVHAHSSDQVEINGEPCRFAREISVGHHLRLIADHVHEARDEILGRWPTLEDSSWSAP